MVEVEVDFCKKLLKDAETVINFIMKKGLYLDKLSNPAMTHNFLQGVLFGNIFCPSVKASEGWKVKKKTNRMEIYEHLSSLKLPDKKVLGY